MRFDCGPTKAERTRQAEEAMEKQVAWLLQWHSVFLLWPRRMRGTHECRWLETVERRFPDANVRVKWLDFRLEFVPRLHQGYAEYRPLGHT